MGDGVALVGEGEAAPLADGDGLGDALDEGLAEADGEDGLGDGVVADVFGAISST